MSNLRPLTAPMRRNDDPCTEFRCGGDESLDSIVAWPEGSFGFPMASGQAKAVNDSLTLAWPDLGHGLYVFRLVGRHVAVWTCCRMVASSSGYLQYGPLSHNCQVRTNFCHLHI